jgi:acetyl esterase/lipase
LKQLAITGVALLVVGTSARAQPITFGQLAALPAPPPAQRISYGADSLQFGHLRLPKGRGPHPVVVFIHGGCFRSQYSITHVAPLEQALADSGYAVWSLEYRRVGNPGGGWPNTFADIALGADHVRQLARSIPLDTTRVIASGHSAGGVFALWLAARHRIDPSSPLFVRNPLRLKGVLALAPVPDLVVAHEDKLCGSVLDQLAGGSPADVPKNYAAISPSQFAPLGLRQAIVVGALDRQFGKYGSAYATDRIAKGDTMVTLVTADSSGHFDMVAPTTNTWRLVMSSLRQLMQR